ncbi:MAG: hypothetical protein JW944_15565 [Deltaproteobacteria bacterium]|nr:hypothetical protein [Deltaproteobacteria bacterium]
MRRCVFMSILLICLTFFVLTQSHAHAFTGNVNLYYGTKSLSDYDWGDLSSQQGFGANADVGFKSWPFNIAVGYISSGYDDTLPEEYTYTPATGPGGFPGGPPGMNLTQTVEVDTCYDTSTRELRLGVKKIWEPTSNMRPFIGFGAAMIQAKSDVNVDPVAAATYDITPTLSDKDEALGLWFSGGVYWTIFISHLFDNINFGVEFAYSQANVEFKEIGGKLNAGGTHYGLFLGYHF